MGTANIIQYRLENGNKVGKNLKPENNKAGMNILRSGLRVNLWGDHTSFSEDFR